MPQRLVYGRSFLVDDFSADPSKYPSFCVFRCEGSSIPLADEALVRKRKEELKHAQVIQTIWSKLNSFLMVEYCLSYALPGVAMRTNYRPHMSIWLNKNVSDQITCNKKRLHYGHK
jgi:hypothetical protein